MFKLLYLTKPGSKYPVETWVYDTEELCTTQQNHSISNGTHLYGVFEIIPNI